MRTRPKTAVPTYRAGTNFREDTRSGYARVDILSQQDLFPNEGYQFPNTGRVPLSTKTYQVSEDSPFNCTVRQKMIKESEEEKVIRKVAGKWMKNDQMCTKAAVRAIATPTPGEVRPINSQMVTQAVKKERDWQSKANDKIRLARMRDEEYWCNVERTEDISTRNIGQTITARKQQRQRALAADYRRQFELHDQVKREEKRQEQLEVQKMQKAEMEEAEKDRQRQEKLRELARQRNREFRARNDELLQRKERRIEEDLAAEKVIQQQREENHKRMEERREWERTRREEKTRIRNNIIERQAKNLAELKANQQKSDSIAESELVKRQEAEHQARIKRQHDMATQRQKDWLEYQRARDMRVMNIVDTPDFVNDDSDAKRRADEFFRAKRERTLRQEQARQIKERQQREMNETAERRRQPDTMFFLKDNDEW